ncbi:MAG: hypothetical protein HOV94_30760 [Saccharothrix sp.]|nr:hypothetical protein [Saccharothrix sp.]
MTHPGAPQQFPPPGQAPYPPGQYPPGQPGGAFPPGRFAPGEQPHGQFPVGQPAPGPFPPGEQPHGQFPPGQQPPGQFAPGQFPPGQQPPGHFPPGQQPGGPFPPGQFAPGPGGPFAPGQFPPPGPPFPPPHGAPGQRGGGGKVVLVVLLVVVVLLGLGGAGYWVFLRDDKPAAPPVDSSQDLAKAPIGCAMFDEAEVAPHIPGRMDYAPGGANPGVRESYDQGQCTWNNTKSFIKDKVGPAHLIVTSYVYHADLKQSGVDRAKEHMKKRVRPGVAVNVKDAEDAMLVTQEKADWTVEVVVRYRNVVYSLTYANQTKGANVKGTATGLATVAIGKVVPGGK